MERTQWGMPVARGGKHAQGTRHRDAGRHRRFVATPLVVSAALLLTATAVQAQDRNARIAELDRRLTAAHARALDLQRTIEALAEELRSLREPAEPDVHSSLRGQAGTLVSPTRVLFAPADPGAAIRPAIGTASPVRPGRLEQGHEEGQAEEVGVETFHEQIVRPDLAEDERGREFTGAPELFIQSRFQALPLEDATIEDAPTNFELTRMETRWSGRLSPKVGLGFELQYHPAPDGAAFEIINDAFVEYYPSRHLTIRAGQFVKPFGFDIQHSSSDRESPERGIFAGYFFPGQRDRGLMLRAGLGSGVEAYLGAFNGNRFFTDGDRKLNFNMRLRKVFAALPLAAGVSAQLGRQLVADGIEGEGHENLVGLDVQWAWRRLGVRAEWVSGDRPSTLLELEPEFAPAYMPGARSTGGALFSMLRLTDRDQVYGRYDRFTGDPVYGYDVRAVNVGYLRRLGRHSRVGVDYQFKNRLTANDDSLNSRLQLTWNVEN